VRHSASNVGVIVVVAVIFVVAGVGSARGIRGAPLFIVVVVVVVLVVIVVVVDTRRAKRIACVGLRRVGRCAGKGRRFGGEETRGGDRRCHIRGV
jgi:hypothetical protein